LTTRRNTGSCDRVPTAVKTFNKSATSKSFRVSASLLWLILMIATYRQAHAMGPCYHLDQVGGWCPGLAGRWPTTNRWSSDIPRRTLQPLRRYKSYHHISDTMGTASSNDHHRPSCRLSSSTHNHYFRCTSRWSKLRDFCASGASAAHRHNGRGGRRRRRATSCNGR